MSEEIPIEKNCSPSACTKKICSPCGLWIIFLLLLALGIGVGTWYFFQHRPTTCASRLHRHIDVRGEAEKKVIADWAEWSLTLRETCQSSEEAAQKIEKDFEHVCNFLLDRGISFDEIKRLPPVIKNNHDRKKDEEKRRSTYIQRINIHSHNVAAVVKAAQEINQIIKNGIELESPSSFVEQVATPCYFYTKGEDLKAELLGDALKNAHILAQTAASTMGIKLGKIHKITPGNLSIRPANWSGSANHYQSEVAERSCVEKSIHLTTRMSFEITP